MRRFSPAQLAAQERFKRMVKSGAWPRRKNRKRRPLSVSWPAHKTRKAKKWAEYWGRKRGNPRLKKWRIVTVSGRGLPTEVSQSGYDTRLAALSMAYEAHDGEFRVEAYYPGRKRNPTLMVMNPGIGKHHPARHRLEEAKAAWRRGDSAEADRLAREAQMIAESAMYGATSKAARKDAWRVMTEAAKWMRRGNRSVPGGVRKWIQSAIRRPGAFSAKARRAGMSTGAYARSVLRRGSRSTTRTKRQAALARTLGRLRMNPYGWQVVRYWKPGQTTAYRGTGSLPGGYYATREEAEEARRFHEEHGSGPIPRLRRVRISEKRRGNPSVPSSAVRMYRRFHGSDPMNVRAIQAPPGTPKHVVMLGHVTELGYRVPGHSGKAGRKNIPYLHRSGKGNILATDATGRNLYILKDRGSRMRVKSDGIND